MTVVTAGNCLKVPRIWSVMFVFTLVRSRTHADTVQTVFQGLTNSRDICWSHTVKVFGWHVTFVKRNLVREATLRNMYVVMKVWSRMFAMNVKSVSVLDMNWKVIIWYTPMSNAFAVVGAVKVWSVKVRQCISRNVLVTWDLLIMFKQHVLCISHGSKWHGIRRYGIPALLWSAWNHTATSFWPSAIPVCSARNSVGWLSGKSLKLLRPDAFPRRKICQKCVCDHP